MATSRPDTSNGLYREWQVPPQAAGTDRKLNWLNSCTEEGQAWLKSQRGYSDWRRALDTISGRMDQVVPEYRSKLNTNHLKRNIREVVGTLSKLRPLWGYSTDNPTYQSQAEMMNKVTRALYLENFYDRSIREALQYASATCTGWVRPIYRRDMAGRGRGEIRLLSYGAPCVLPVQLPSSCDYQQAYAVTLLDEMPIYMAHGMFPKYQDQLRPTSSLYWYSSEIRQSSRGNIWKRVFGWGKADSTASGLADLMVPIRYTTVIDLSINTTKSEIPMGEPGTSWFYKVPYVGQDIPAGRTADGHLTYRKADENDARLYPYRRMLISSETCVMYDGPAFNWHGRLDLIPFQLDSWAWEPLGFSITRDGYDIQLAINELSRGVVDKCRAQNDMALAYDINAVTSREAKQFDPMQPRARVGFDGSATDMPFRPPVPPEVLMVKPELFTMLEWLKSAMDEELAIKDVMALAKARLAGDDMEKLLEANGPIIEDMSRCMEPPMREIGSQIKYLILQYETTARLMQYVGADNVSVEVFDYDPTRITPSHMAGEDSKFPSAYSPQERARTFADSLRFLITPHSLHEITQMAYKLGLIQLRKAQVQIDSETIAEAWQVRNYGNIPGSTVREKWRIEQEENLEFAARMKELGASLTGQQAISPGGAAAAGKQQEGRPPSGGAAPALKQKPDGRSTITESQGGGQVI